MILHGLITKTIAWEFALFNGRISYTSIYNTLDLDIRYKGDHKGVFFSITLLSYVIVEANIYSTLHDIEHNNE